VVRSTKCESFTLHRDFPRATDQGTACTVTRELAELFRTLAVTNAKSIRPAQQLAYLALVTAADESGANPPMSHVTSTDKVIADKASASSETTLVNDAVFEPNAVLEGPVAPGSNAAEVTETILGKRTSQDRDHDDQMESLQERDPPGAITPSSVVAMDEGVIDSPTSPSARPTVRLRSRSASAMITVSSASEAPSPKHETHVGEVESPRKSFDTGGTSSNDTSAVMEVDDPVKAATTAPAPPPLPPRSGSMSVNVNMMFGESICSTNISLFLEADILFTGQQHDVSECMDNILFQIEASLDEAKTVDSDGQSSNLLKRSGAV
jgi:ubiquitin carboxyl-terminal hydrolase 25/28